MDTLIGTWKLRAFKVINSDRTVDYPMGEGATGFIMYDETGYMSVAIMADDRDGSPKDGMPYLSYVGQYTVSEGVVRHRIQICNLPDWMGLEQVRSIELHDGILILRGGVPGSESVVQVEWMRV